MIKPAPHPSLGRVRQRMPRHKSLCYLKHLARSTQHRLLLILGESGPQCSTPLKQWPARWEHALHQLCLERRVIIPLQEGEACRRRQIEWLCGDVGARGPSHVGVACGDDHEVFVCLHWLSIHDEHAISERAVEARGDAGNRAVNLIQHDHAALDPALTKGCGSLSTARVHKTQQLTEARAGHAHTRTLQPKCFSGLTRAVRLS